MLKRADGLPGWGILQWGRARSLHYLLGAVGIVGKDLFCPFIPGHISAACQMVDPASFPDPLVAVCLILGEYQDGDLCQLRAQVGPLT